MKKYPYLFSVILIIFSIFQGFAQKQLNSFDEIMAALNTGKEVRVVLHYSKCQLISDNEIQEKVPEAIGGMIIQNYEYFAKNAVKNQEPFVVTSTTQFIKYPKGDGFVHNYIKIRVNPDGKVKINAQYLKTGTFESVMDENFFCEINNGKNEAGAYFYQNE